MTPTRRASSFIMLGAAAAACFATAALAAGTGAGTAPVSGTRCDKDAWNCTEWGACAGGARTRVCTLETDCPGVDTPKPAENERCETAAKGCTADTWVCEDWLRCDAKGNQHRDCRLTVDCADVQTVKPTADRPCPTLQCGELPSLRERIACRLKLEPSGIAREDEIRYMPELCRVAPDDAAVAACIALSRAFAACGPIQSADERTDCARNAVGLGADLKAQDVACREMDDPGKTDCLAALRKKVYDLVVFRMSDLENRTDAFRKNGVPDDVIVAFRAKAEEAMAAFRAAATKDDRRKAVLALRADWQAFLSSAKPFLR